MPFWTKIRSVFLEDFFENQLRLCATFIILSCWVWQRAIVGNGIFFFVKNRVHGVMNHKFANIRKLVIVTSSDLQGTYVFFSIFLEGRGLLLYVNGKKNTQL